jgi:hypothetical protein
MSAGFQGFAHKPETLEAFFRAVDATTSFPKTKLQQQAARYSNINMYIWFS